MRALVHVCLLAVLASTLPLQADAQTRLAILQAEARRAPTPRDLATIRAGASSADPQTRRIAVRALGRLERPALVSMIVPALKAPWPEIRAEAANAVGQAVQGKGPMGAVTLESLMATLADRLAVEDDAGVREALCETIGRLPYSTTAQIDRAEMTLVDMAGRSSTTLDRLGVAKGLEALGRLHQKTRPLGAAALSVLRNLAAPGGDVTGGARVRRLGFEALIRADAADEALVERGMSDADAQVRRLAVLAARSSRVSETAPMRGLTDSAAMVRIEALRSLGRRSSAALCPSAMAASSDRDTHVSLVALDQLSACRGSTEAAALLERMVNDLSQAGSPRAWHRGAHALVALATAEPDLAASALPQYAGSTIWQLRVYAARAAALLGDRAALDKLAFDADDNVREAAIDGLSRASGHSADDVYVGQLGRNGHQVLRAAALALDGTPRPEIAIVPLKAALARLEAEGRDNSHGARAAISDTLTKLRSAPSPQRRPPQRPDTSELTAEALRRYASPIARIVVSGVGTIELALIGVEAPATVIRFARLAEAGYYNGLTFHRVEPNFVIQGGSPGANEYIGEAAFMRDELGKWPHVRGAAGISTRGRDTGDAQFFVDLIDHPRFDHDYTVFGQVLNGIEVADSILEGDVIESIQIVPGP